MNKKGSSNMKVLCIGKSCIEEILYFDGFPKEGINCN